MDEYEYTKEIEWMELHKGKISCIKKVAKYILFVAAITGLALFAKFTS